MLDLIILLYIGAMLPSRTNYVNNDIASLVIEQCSAGLAILNQDLCFTWLNTAFAERFGGVHSLIGDPLANLDAEPPHLIDTAIRATTNQRAFLLRAARLRVGGQETLHDLMFTPQPNGEVLLEIYPPAPHVETTHPRLSESLRGFAHEVKNPLAGVRGAAQLLRRRLEQPDLAELADLIIAEADRLSTLADRLLHTSGKPRLTRINVHEMLERVNALLNVENTDVSLERDYDPSLPAITADADRLQQLVLNLTRNAIEAGASTLIVRTRAEHGVRVGERLLRLGLRIDVVDDGRGVPVEIAETLFQPLVSGRADGTGLGLALSQEIAREHGGELCYLSRPGNTVFTLHLPLEEPRTAERHG